MPDIDGLIDRWFGDWDDERPLPSDEPHQRLWWGADPRVDAELRVAFTGDHLAAAKGALDEDAARDPRSAIARILLLDQIPRNVWRGTAHAFATDRLAQRASFELLASTLWDRTPPIHRYFALMPLMHAEVVGLQDRCVREFTVLAGQMEGSARSSTYAGAVGFAVRHADVVRRFGRFPHRNAALGRPSTPEELAHLASGRPF